MRDSALSLLLVHMLLLLFGVMAAVQASGGSAKRAVMAGIMTGNAAHHRALQAAPGLGAVSDEGERGKNETCGDDFHDNDPS